MDVVLAVLAREALRERPGTGERSVNTAGRRDGGGRRRDGRHLIPNLPAAGMLKRSRPRIDEGEPVKIRVPLCGSLRQITGDETFRQSDENALRT